MRQHWWRGTTLFFAGTILLAACSSGSSPSGSAAGSTAAQPSGSAATSSGTKELDDALAGKYDGKVVTAYGPFVDEDEAKFLDMVKVFEDATGIDVQYEGTKQFEQDITVRVDAGNVADIVDFPQPALLATFAKSGKIVDLSPYLSQDYLESKYVSSWLDTTSMEGASGTITAGVWERVNAKSNVWYPKAAFDAAGYKVPTTWDELTALADQIVADGDAPWCVGIESGVATGWPATDWIEDIMLRTTSPENYDAWVKGDLKFSSPEVKAAWQTLSDIWLDPTMVYGGKAAIVATAFGDAPAPMFTDPPKCWLHRQGNFITSFFPETAKMGTDYDFFYFPPIDEKYGKPMLVGGDIWAVFNEKPEVLALEEWYTSAKHLEPWMASGGALAPQSDVDLSKYGSEVERSVAAVLGEATTIRFDASDAMPAAVGTGTFWKEVTSYINGDVTLDAALKAIDDSWPH
jgi:alpha-glucoside transport system substrate-binding protein